MNIAEVFKALGDPTRLKIIKLIISMGNNLCVGAIANKLKITQPAVSQHLRILKNAGLAKANRKGYHIHYSINSDSFDAYGIDSGKLLKTITDDFNTDLPCEYTDDPENCAKLNK